jgi:hypothetical protein
MDEHTLKWWKWYRNIHKQTTSIHSWQVSQTCLKVMSNRRNFEVILINVSCNFNMETNGRKNVKPSGADPSWLPGQVLTCLRKQKALKVGWLQKKRGCKNKSGWGPWVGMCQYQRYDCRRSLRFSLSEVLLLMLVTWQLLNDNDRYQMTLNADLMIYLMTAFVTKW